MLCLKIQQRLPALIIILKFGMFCNLLVIPCIENRTVKHGLQESAILRGVVVTQRYNYDKCEAYAYNWDRSIPICGQTRQLGGSHSQTKIKRDEDIANWLCNCFTSTNA